MDNHPFVSCETQRVKLWWCLNANYDEIYLPLRFRYSYRKGVPEMMETLLPTKVMICVHKEVKIGTLMAHKKSEDTRYLAWSMGFVSVLWPSNDKVCPVRKYSNRLESLCAMAQGLNAQSILLQLYMSQSSMLLLGLGFSTRSPDFAQWLQYVKKVKRFI